jgi:hypothetical protein
MKLFRVNDMDEYVELVMLTGEMFAQNYIGDEIPMFPCVSTLEANLDLDFQDIYDENGELYVDTGAENLLRDIPKDAMVRELTKRMDRMEVSFPLQVVVYAEYAFDRTGETSLIIFVETNEEPVPGLKTPDESLK